MTVPTVSGTTGAIAGDGSNNVWPFTFSVANADQVEVYRTSSAGGATLLDPSVYTVALSSGGAGGGAVTYPPGESRVPSGESITVQLAPDLGQPTALTDQGDYNPSTVERALDHLARQIMSLFVSIGRALLAPPGVSVRIAQPIDGSPTYWAQSSDGTFVLSPGSSSSAPSPEQSAEERVLYADDLGLLADGTDETDTINAKLLELSETGKTYAVFLKSSAGYWPLTTQLKVRSGITLAMGSPFRATKNGQVGFVGNYSRDAAGATVRVATAAGATTIPVTPTAGSVSASFVAEDQVELANGQRVRVTSVDDGLLTITVNVATTSDMAVGGSIRKLVFTYISSSWTRHDTPNELTVADNSIFSTGDIVLVTDDELTTNVDTAGTFEINKEIAKVIGFGSGTVKLDRGIKHWMTTGNRARIVKLNPCRHASISGATVEFVEAPDADRVDTFECSIAWKCQIVDSTVPNDDAFGTRGRSFSLDLCYQCDVINCYSGPAKFKNAGEGYGVAFSHSTDCAATSFRALGSRHVVSFLSSTDCTVRAVSGSDWELNLIDWHGLRSIGCWAYEVNGVGSGRSSQSGIVLGNPSWRAGDYECGAEGGEITDLQGASSRFIRAWGPMADCDVRDIVFRRGTTGIHSLDQAGDGTVEVGELRVRCDFHRCERAAAIDMNNQGSVDKPFNRLDITGSRFFDCEDGLLFDSVDDLVIRDVVYRTSVATVDTYVLEVLRSTAANIVRMQFDGAQKHIKLIDCPARLDDCQVRRPNTTVWIDELSLTPIANGVRDHGLVHPSDWVPARVSAQSTLTVHSRPGMT